MAEQAREKAEERAQAALAEAIVTHKQALKRAALVLLVEKKMAEAEVQAIDVKLAAQLVRAQAAFEKVVKNGG